MRREKYPVVIESKKKKRGKEKHRRITVDLVSATAERP